MSIAWYPAARDEFLAAVDHYTALRPALAVAFTDAVETLLASLAENPDAGLELGPAVRRRLMRVFPYALLYSREGDDITILAVMHCHRERGYWQARLSTKQV